MSLCEGVCVHERTLNILKLKMYFHLNFFNGHTIYGHVSVAILKPSPNMGPPQPFWLQCLSGTQSNNITPNLLPPLHPSPFPRHPPTLRGRRGREV